MQISSLGCSSQTELFKIQWKRLNSTPLSLNYSELIFPPALLKSIGYDQIICAYKVVQPFPRLTALAIWGPVVPKGEKSSVE